MRFSFEKFSSLSHIRLILICISLITIFFSLEVSNRRFATPDEARYVEISREMAETNDFITPRLNGVKYFEKPPLFYWLESIAIKIGGIDFFKMRIVEILLAAFGCLSVMLAAVRYGIQASILSGVILSTTLLYYIKSRFISLDLLLSVMMSASLWCYLLAFTEIDKRITNKNKKFLIFSFYVFSALAVLAKGLIGIVLPGLIIFVWLIFNGAIKSEKIQTIKESLYVPGILAFLIIAAPWHILCSYKNHDFAYFYFIYEHFIRYATTAHHRYQPVWFFVPILLVGLLPWTGFCLISIKDCLKKRSSDNVFLLSWISCIFIFFSISNSKLIPYIVPIFPPIALITGRFLSGYISGEKVNIRSGFYISFFIILIAITVGVMCKDMISNVSGECTAILHTIFVSIAIIFVASELILYFIKTKKVAKPVLISFFAIMSFNLMFLVNRLAPFYQEAKKPSVYEIAKAISYNLTTDVEVFCYGEYFQDLPVYLNRLVGVVDYMGELEFGIKAENHNNRFMSSEDFLKKFKNAKNRIFVCFKTEEYKKVFEFFECEYKILELDKNFVLVINK